MSKRPAGTRTEKVHAALRRAILDQRLSAGERLPEDAIGQTFGTSRTIAREALARLAMEGLVDLVPNRGAFVAHPTLEEARDIFALRKGLERMVAQALAGRMTPEIAADLRRHCADEAAAAARDAVSAIRLAGEFHLRLAGLTGNALLSRYVTELVSRCSLVLAMYGRPHSIECGVREHEAIIAALEAGDGAAAAEIMDRHLDAVAGRALIGGPERRDIREILAPYADSA